MSANVRAVPTLVRVAAGPSLQSLVMAMLLCSMQVGLNSKGSYKDGSTSLVMAL